MQVSDSAEQIPDSRSQLWNRLYRLGGVVHPRVWRWNSENVKAVSDRGPSSFAILSEDWVLAEPALAEHFLDLLEMLLQLDSSIWKGQYQFFRALLGSFFKNTNAPAWISVHGSRTGFVGRTSARLSPLHRGQLGAERIPILCLDRAKLSLNGIDVPMRGIKVFHHFDLPDKTIQFQRIFIHRTLKPNTNSSLLYELEERMVAVSDDPEDLRVAATGVTPSLEFFRDKTADFHASPLVSLCRINAIGRIEARVFSLRPFVGEVADIRICAYRPEYYFRSDLSTHAMLEKLITPGEYEKF